MLRFIKARGLIRFHEGDLVLRSCGEEKWRNDFSWVRQDAKDRALLSMPENGFWKLTQAGRIMLEEKARLWSDTYSLNPESISENLARCRRINEVTFTRLVPLSQGDDISKNPALLPLSGFGGV